MKIALILALILLPAGSNAQPLPKFDVASVRPAGPYTGGFAGGVRIEGKRLIAEQAGLTSLIDFAWDVRGFQISGGPSWKDGGMLGDPDRFHVEAKIDSDDTPTTGQMRLMLQSLLAERFKLKVSVEKKPFPAWDLVVDKGGPKIKPSAEAAAFSLRLEQRKGPRMSLTGTAITMERLLKTGWVGQHSGRPVIDKTGLSGTYDFQLQWTTDMANADTEIPDFATALRDQLGLRLQSSTTLLDALTIEHVERPSEN